MHGWRKGELKCQAQLFSHCGGAQLQEEEVIVLMGEDGNRCCPPLCFVSWADSKQVPTWQPRAHWMPKAYLGLKKMFKLMEENVVMYIGLGMTYH